MEVPNESQKRKLEETTSTEETPKEMVEVAAAAEEPSTKKAKVDLDLNLQDITPAKIKKQIEYYFSDSNYRRDKWLQEEAAKHPEGFIEIAKIAAFPRLQAMTTDLNVVVELMRSSDRLTVSEDGTLVKRSLPLPAEDNSIHRSIFVKGLPEDVTIDTVEAFFVKYGAVARVNLFRERDTKKPKGEAFVEFETEDAAKAALATEKQEYNGREITVSAKKPMRERSEKKEKKHDRSEEQKQSAAEAEEESRKAKEERTERMKGTILHVTLAGEEGQEFNPDFNKWDVKTVFEEIVAGDVKFVDLGVKQAWARMLTPEAAQKALAEVTANPKEVKGVKFINTRLLEGDEEKAYIEKVLEEGDRKFGRGGRGRGGRGGRGGSRGGRGRGNRGRGRN